MAITLALVVGVVGGVSQPSGATGPGDEVRRRTTTTSSTPSPIPPGAPRVPGEAITFSEHPLGTAITTQYQDRGVHFGGDSPFITGDGSNPTSPVLSGSPQFHGAIEIKVVHPETGQPATTAGLALDVGYIDNRNSVEVAYYDLTGTKLGAIRANAWGSTA